MAPLNDDVRPNGQNGPNGQKGQAEGLDRGIDALAQEKGGLSGFALAKADEFLNWARSNSMWPLTFGLACCALEMMSCQDSRFDMARFGSEIFRPSPRQADLMIVAGTVTKRMAPRVKTIYDQMADPKYVIAMGACTINGGPYQTTYSVVKGVDLIVPVDVHCPGCPPTPNALLHALMTLQEKIRDREGGYRVPPLVREELQPTWQSPS